MTPVARQVGCLFSEIFATFFGIKSLNNLLFNKFKCKLAWAASYRGRAQCDSCNNSKYRKQDYFCFVFCFVFSHSMSRIALVSKKGDQNHAYLI